LPQGPFEDINEAQAHFETAGERLSELRQTIATRTAENRRLLSGVSDKIRDDEGFVKMREREADYAARYAATSQRQEQNEATWKSDGSPWEGDAYDRYDSVSEDIRKERDAIRNANLEAGRQDTPTAVALANLMLREQALRRVIEAGEEAEGMFTEFLHGPEINQLSARVLDFANLKQETEEVVHALSNTAASIGVAIPESIAEFNAQEIRQAIPAVATGFRWGERFSNFFRRSSAGGLSRFATNEQIQAWTEGKDPETGQDLAPGTRGWRYKQELDRLQARVQENQAQAAVPAQPEGQPQGALAPAPEANALGIHPAANLDAAGHFGPIAPVEGADPSLGDVREERHSEEQERNAQRAEQERNAQRAELWRRVGERELKKVARDFHILQSFSRELRDTDVLQGIIPDGGVFATVQQARNFLAQNHDPAPRMHMRNQIADAEKRYNELMAEPRIAEYREAQRLKDFDNQAFEEMLKSAEGFFEWDEDGNFREVPRGEKEPYPTHRGDRLFARNLKDSFNRAKESAQRFDEASAMVTPAEVYAIENGPYIRSVLTKKLNSIDLLLQRCKETLCPEPVVAPIPVIPAQAVAHTGNTALEPSPDLKAVTGNQTTTDALQPNYVVDGDPIPATPPSVVQQ
jgi:hypothetical protein